MTSRFSDRIGVTQPVTSIQVESMNEELRNSLWNVIVGYWTDDSLGLYKAIEAIQVGVFKEPVDDISGSSSERRQELLIRYSELEWYDVYNLIEFLVENVDRIEEMNGCCEDLSRRFNTVFEREVSGYRFISGVLTPISNEAEVASIEEAIAEAERKGFAGAHTHITTSLKALGQKPEPDYRNSIKEAISAVESAVDYINGSKGGGLKKALSKLSSQSEIHKALVQGFIKLYGYSSDEDGIRHAIFDQPNVGFDEAKFMVVACSAFVNFLIAKAEAASLLGDN